MGFLEKLEKTEGLGLKEPKHTEELFKLRN